MPAGGSSGSTGAHSDERSERVPTEQPNTVTRFAVWPQPSIRQNPRQRAHAVQITPGSRPCPARPRSACGRRLTLNQCPRGLQTHRLRGGATTAAHELRPARIDHQSPRAHGQTSLEDARASMSNLPSVGNPWSARIGGRTGNRRATSGDPPDPGTLRSAPGEAISCAGLPERQVVSSTRAARSSVVLRRSARPPPTGPAEGLREGLVSRRRKTSLDGACPLDPQSWRVFALYERCGGRSQRGTAPDRAQNGKPKLYPSTNRYDRGTRP